VPHCPSPEQWHDAEDYHATVVACFPLHRLSRNESIDERERDRKFLAHFAARIADAGGIFDTDEARFMIKLLNADTVLARTTTIDRNCNTLYRKCNLTAS
jgi:hypothetical protein